MSERANVKPLMHWLIYRHFTARITSRAPELVKGVMTTSHGTVPFNYDPATMVVTLPGAKIKINEYGWEIDLNELGSSHSPGGDPPAQHDESNHG